MSKVVFPDDFAVCYTEGASFWWWSPEGDTQWGLMVGNPESADHVLTTGDAAMVRWTSFDEDGPSEETDCLLEAEDVQGMVDRVLERVSADHGVDLQYHRIGYD